MTNWAIMLEPSFIQLPKFAKIEIHSILQRIGKIWTVFLKHFLIVGYHFSSRLTATPNLCPIYLKLLLHVL